MKYILKILLVFIVGCSSIYIQNSLPVYYSTQGIFAGWDLKLNEDSTYLYNYWSCIGSSYSEGYWYQKCDTLILNSYSTSEVNSVLKLGVKDSSKLGISNTIEDLIFNKQLIFFKNKKLLYDGDKLFMGHNNGDYFDRNNPALKKY